MELEKDSDIHSARDDKAFVAMGTEGKRSVLAELFPEPGDQQTCSGPHPLSFQNLVLWWTFWMSAKVLRLALSAWTLYYIGLAGIKETNGDFGWILHRDVLNLNT